MQRDEAELAIEAFNEYISTHAKDRRVGDAHYYLALLHRQRGDGAAANNHINKVSNPTYVTPEALHLMSGQLKLEIGDVNAAVAALQKVDSKKLPDADTQATWAYLLGVAYRGVGQQRLAADHFDIASEADSPVRGLALMELGKTRLALDQPPAALEALAFAIEVGLGTEHLAEARTLAAGLAYEEGQFGLATDLYTQLIDYHASIPNTPVYTAAPMGLLRSLYAAEADDQLVKRYAQLAGRLGDADLGEAMYLAAAGHVRQEQFKDALAILAAYYKRYRAGHPLSDEVFYLYAICFYQTDLDGFEKWFAEAQSSLGDSPHRYELLYLRAQTAVKRAKIKDAIAHLAPLINETPNAFARRSLLQRAALREQVGDTQSAEIDFANYAALYGDDPQAASAGRRAIDLAFTAGRFDRVAQLASPWLGRSSLTPEVAAPVRFKFAVALIKLDRSAEALAQFEGLLTLPLSPSIESLTHYYRGLLLATRAQESTPADGADSTAAPIAALQKALEGELEDTYHVHALALVARLHRMAERDDQARAAYLALRQEQPLNDFGPLTLLWVGRELQHDRRYPEALSWLLGMVDRQDTPEAAVSEGLFLIAQSQQALDQIDEAIESYTRLIAHSRGYGDQGRLGLAQVLAAASRIDEALDEYEGLINIEASRIAATAALESGLLYLERARRLEQAGDKAAAETFKFARKRLELVRIVYDVPQLRLLSGHAMVVLAALDADAGAATKAKKTIAHVLADPQKSPWHDIARAERLALEGHRADGVFLMRRAAKGDATAGDDSYSGAGFYSGVLLHAQQRLGQWGESP